MRASLNWVLGFVLVRFCQIFLVGTVELSVEPNGNFRRESCEQLLPTVWFFSSRGGSLLVGALMVWSVPAIGEVTATILVNVDLRPRSIDVVNEEDRFS